MTVSEVLGSCREQLEANSNVAYTHTREMDCLVCLFYLPYLANMILQIFKEGANFRGALKKVASEVVKRAYKDAIDPDFEHGSQRDFAILVQRNIETLLEGSFFLRDGVDEQVHSWMFYLFHF